MVALSIILTLLIFTIIVVIHEWGHMIVAKKCNVSVEEFAVGMGPKLWGVKKGETLYSIRCLPLGGYCKMTDEADENGKVGFNQLNVWKRMSIAFAGPLMNFVLAFVVMIGLSMVTAVTTTVVVNVSDNSPAKQCDIRQGDKVISINGKKTPSYNYISYYLSYNQGEDIELTILRDGKRLVKNITPQYNEEANRYIMGIACEGLAPLIDVGFYEYEGTNYTRADLWDCIADGYNNTIFIVKVTFEGFMQLFTGQVGVDQLSGPIGVTTAVGDTYQEAAKIGVFPIVASMLKLVVLLSANLGILNLLPVPGLDGGRILIFIVEIIRRKQLPPEKEGMVNLIGLALIMLLGIVIAYNDILKLI